MRKHSRFIKKLKCLSKTDVTAFVGGVLLSRLLIRRVPGLTVALSSTWLCSHSKCSNPYMNVLISFLIATTLGFLLGVVAELILILSALAFADGIRIWKEHYDARLQEQK